MTRCSAGGGNIAATAAFSQVTVTRYGKTETIAVHAFTCLWYCVTGAKTVTVVLIRDKSKTGYDLALVTAQQRPGIAAVIERYAASILVSLRGWPHAPGPGHAPTRVTIQPGRTRVPIEIPAGVKYVNGQSIWSGRLPVFATAAEGTEGDGRIHRRDVRG